MRLIDADELLKTIDYSADVGGALGKVVECVKYYAKFMVASASTIEPERKKGHWIRHDEIKNVYGGICIECSECGEKYVVQHILDEKYCRNCGADMRGEEDD